MRDRSYCRERTAKCFCFVLYCTNFGLKSINKSFSQAGTGGLAMALQCHIRIIVVQARSQDSTLRRGHKSRRRRPGVSSAEKTRVSRGGEWEGGITISSRLGGLESVVSSPSGVRQRIFGIFEVHRTLLV